MAAAVCRKNFMAMFELPGFGVLTLPVFQCHAHIMISVYKYVGHTEEFEPHKNGYLMAGCHDQRMH
jgi:hypothetical protein